MSALRPRYALTSRSQSALDLGRVLRLAVVLLVCCQVVAGGLGVVTPRPAAADHGQIKFPFAAGADWYVSQGYNTSPAEGWSHYNCDPSTLKDEISRTESCNAGWQYKYSLRPRRDRRQHRRSARPLARQRHDPLDRRRLRRHVDRPRRRLRRRLLPRRSGARSRGRASRSARARTSAPSSGPGGGGNGGTPHIHLTVWQTTTAATGAGCAVPSPTISQSMATTFRRSANSERNQHWNQIVVSTNRHRHGEHQRHGELDDRAGHAGASHAAVEQRLFPARQSFHPELGSNWQCHRAPGGDQQRRADQSVASRHHLDGRAPAGRDLHLAGARRNDAGESTLSDPWSFIIEDRGEAPAEAAQAEPPPADAGSDEKRSRSDDPATNENRNSADATELAKAKADAARERHGFEAAAPEPNATGSTEPLERARGR